MKEKDDGRLATAWLRKGQDGVLSKHIKHWRRGSGKVRGVGTKSSAKGRAAEKKGIRGWGDSRDSLI
jgi:hypothetical protein